MYQSVFILQPLDRSFQSIHDTATASIGVICKRTSGKARQLQSTAKPKRCAHPVKPEVVRIIPEHRTIILQQGTVIIGKEDVYDFLFRGANIHGTAEQTLGHGGFLSSAPPNMV
jgi:hypothetical protein